MNNAKTPNLLFGTIVAAVVLLSHPIRVHGEEVAPGLPQKPVVAAAVVVVALLKWGGLVGIELFNDETAVIKITKPNPWTNGEFAVLQLSKCSFEFGGPKGLRIDFDRLSNEYSFQARSTGLILTFKGLREAPAVCNKGSCYYDLQIGGSSGGLQRVLRAIQFISDTSCPLRQAPF
jgi:hypothetical protein